MSTPRKARSSRETDQLIRWASIFVGGSLSAISTNTVSQSTPTSVSIDDVPESHAATVEDVGNIFLRDNAPAASTQAKFTVPLHEGNYFSDQEAIQESGSDLVHEGGSGSAVLGQHFQQNTFIGAPVQSENGASSTQVFLVAGDSDAESSAPLTVEAGTPTSDSENGDTNSVATVNLAPTATDDVGFAVGEGGTVIQAAAGLLANDTDPETDTLTVNTTPVVDVTHGTLTLNADGSFTYVHNGNNATEDTFTYQITDTAGNTSTAIATITISNVAPTVTIAGPFSGNEGASIALSANAIDPGVNDTLTYEWDFNYDGMTFDVDATGVDLTAPNNTYADNGSYTVAVRVTDSDTGVSAIETQTVTVDNVAPTIALSGNASVDEGSSFTLNLGAVTDPGNDTVTTYRVDWGDGNVEDFGVAGNHSHIYTDNATHTIQVTLIDEDGTFSNVSSHAVTVNNVAPDLTATGNDNVDERASYTLNLGAVVDPGDDTPTSFQVDWGDGAIETYSAVGNHTHVYSTDGNYTINVSIIDEDGAFANVATKAVTVNDVALPTNIDLTALTAAQGFEITGIDGAKSVVSGAGDFDGDGYDDILIGAPNSDVAASNSGEVHVILGDGATPGSFDVDAPAGLTMSSFLGESASDAVGFSIAAAGDVNNDGAMDFVIGASGAEESYVIYGNGNILAMPSSAFNINAGNGYEFNSSPLGFSVSGSGDMNQDGLSDVLFSSPTSSGSLGLANSGEVNLVLSSNGAPTTVSFSGGAIGDNVGHSVSYAGDMNGDGFGDYIVSAPGESSVYVVYGNANPLTMPATTADIDGTNGFKITGVNGGSIVVTNVGDVNADGFDDVVIGVPHADTGGSESGEAYLMTGGTSIAASVAANTLKSFIGGGVNENVGSAVSGLGDVNGDGFDDFVLGAPGADESYVIFGSSNVLSLPADPTELDGTNGFQLSGVSTGDSVSGAGDVNGDGFDDIVVGGDGGGSAYVVFGQATASMILGSSEANNLTGQATADLIAAGAGDDTIDGAGGADVIHAGAGDDIITFYESYLASASIDGGGGNDTLVFDGSNQSLDLTAFNSGVTGASPFTNIEVINLTPGDNTLTLDAGDVAALSENSNTLIIDGNSGDVVTVETTLAWTDNGIVNQGGADYHSYTHGEVTILVNENIDSNDFSFV